MENFGSAILLNVVGLLASGFGLAVATTPFFKALNFMLLLCNVFLLGTNFMREGLI